jgi:sulfhydrogenase subunit beta (sulfur reductase)
MEERKRRAGVLAKKSLHSWMEGLLDRYQVYCPVEKDGAVEWRRIASPGEACLEYSNTRLSPKHLFLPQTEALFSYQAGRDRLSLDVPSGAGSGRVLFGVRPCDARGISFLDRVFGRDSYYQERRKGTWVVALGCPTPQPGCFCRFTGGGPFSAEGSDLMLADIGDAYVVFPGTERGEALLDGLDVQEAGESDLSLAREAAGRAEACMEEAIDPEALRAKLTHAFHHPLWQELTEGCLSCGVCTYLCPTCYCFDLSDEGKGQEGERIRTWDSCQFPVFTKQASGFNPRPTGKERFRQRIMHKFSYLVEDQGGLGCTGCGRCVSRCPVNLDIRELVKAFLGIQA